MKGVTVQAIAASASGRLSEDAYGYIGDANFGAAWVLDGATGLGDREYVQGACSDAAWYAQQLSSALRKFSLEQVPADKIFLSAIRWVAQQWYEAIGDADVPRYALPSAAGVWVRWQGDTMEAVSLSDCRGYHRSDVGVVTQLGALSVDPNDDWVAAKVAQHQAAGVTPEQMRGAILEDLRTRRSFMNVPGGYWVFSIHDETAAHLDARAWQITSGNIILCSDGLFRWVDVLGQGGAEVFIKACTADLNGVLARVRQVENADADCKIYKRLKQHDDATGIVLRCQIA